MTSIADGPRPTRADLDAATASTAAVLADPTATHADRVHAAEMEQAVHNPTCSAPALTPSCRPKRNWRQAHDPRPRSPRPAHRLEYHPRNKPRNHPAADGPGLFEIAGPARRRAPGM